MGRIVGKTVEIKWHNVSKKHYANLGYVFTKIKDTFGVLVEHLSKGSIVIVTAKCDICGKEWKMRRCDFYGQNCKSCAQKEIQNRPEVKKVKSMAQKKRYKDPVEREKQREIQNRSDVREKKIKSLKETNKKPEVIERRRKAQKEVMSRLGAREKHSKTMKKAMNKPGMKEKLSKAQKEVMSRPGVRENISEITKKVMNKPDVKKKHKRIMKEVMNKPEVIEARNKPEAKEKHRKATKEAQNRPGVKKAKSEGLEKAWQDGKFDNRRGVEEHGKKMEKAWRDGKFDNRKGNFISRSEEDLSGNLKKVCGSEDIQIQKRIKLSTGETKVVDIFIEPKQVYIEFDGPGHFESIYGDKAFEYTKRKDKLEEDWCKENKKILIRVKDDIYLNNKEKTIKKIMEIIENEIEGILKLYKEEDLEILRDKFYKDFKTGKEIKFIA